MTNRHVVKKEPAFTLVSPLKLHGWQECYITRLYYLPLCCYVVIALCINQLPNREITVDIDGFMGHKTSYSHTATRIGTE